MPFIRSVSQPLELLEPPNLRSVDLDMEDNVSVAINHLLH